MPVKIKICGITQYEDARVAAGLGVDALGFIFYNKSKRYIHPQDARNIIRRLPPFISRVGVFVNDSVATIMEIARETGIDAVQLHGEESPSLCEALPMTRIKAFAVGPDFDLSLLDEYPVQGFLLDTWSESQKGGTGRTFDWSIAREAAQKHHNIILAGGLGPTNIEEALESVQPWAVEFNSGVEIRPGVKNPLKMRDAITLVKNWK